MNFILILLTAQLATQATHYLIQRKGFGSVRASTLVTIVFVVGTSTPFEMGPVLHAACLGGSFVGMSDPKRLSVNQLGLASVVFSLFFNFFMLHFKGLGGALGFSAFISCVFIYLLFNLLSKSMRKIL